MKTKGKREWEASASDTGWDPLKNRGRKDQVGTVLD